MEAKQTPLIDLLEAIPEDARLVVEHDQFSSSYHPVGRLCREAAAALKAALVEDAMQKFTDVNQELMAALGCEHCNQPLYAAIKCRVCGRVTEPVQEPVANDDEVICPACCHQFRAIPPNVQQMMLDAGFEPPFTAPPQREPLTEEEIDGLMQSIGLRCADDGNERMANHAEWERRQRRRIARVIERAHEIGGSDEA